MRVGSRPEPPPGTGWSPAVGAVPEELWVEGPWTDAAADYWRSVGRPPLIYSARRDADIEWVAGLDLRRLRVAGTVADDTAVERCGTLQYLSLNTDCTLPLTLAHLPLHGLRLLEDRIVGDLPRGLETASIRGWKGDDLARLSGLDALTSLELGGPRLRHLTGAALACVRELSLVRCRNVRGLAGLEALTSLEFVSLYGLSELTDLTPLALLPRLTEIELASCRRVESLRPLAHCPSLETVRIHGTTEIADADIAVAATFPHLTHLLLERWPARYNASRAELAHLS